VASALANKVHALGVHVKVEDDQMPQEALRDTFAWFLGAEVGGWEYQLPTADGLRRSVEEWVGRACNAKGVWPSQAAAIQALVLHGASPSEARAAVQAAFSARQGETRVRGNRDSPFLRSYGRMGAPGQCSGLGLRHTTPAEGSQSPPPLCHLAEVPAVAGEFSLGREVSLLRR